MIIVCGWLRIESERRDAYLASCLESINAARATSGCIDFHLTADPIEADRINVFEQWESSDAIDAFRGSGPDDEQMNVIVEAHVEQHEIASTTSLM